ncbi:MAG: c-type cytochrome [Acidobacteria bacterium]|nr:c-type cytochrome [Acidobacteriota bacterium]
MNAAKRFVLICGLCLFPLVFLTPAQEKSSTTGKDLFKQNCRVCHSKDSAQGEYSPLSLIQDQWKKFFTTKFASTHKDVRLPGQEKKLLETLTPEQLKTLQKYCIDHAADSEQPQTCSG